DPDGEVLLHAGFVEPAEDRHQVLGARGGLAFHVGPHQRTEDTDRRNAPDRSDPVDGGDRGRRRLETGDDLAIRHPGLEAVAVLAERGAILDGLQVVREAVLAVLPWADAPEDLLVEDLEAERDAVHTHLPELSVA